MMFRLIALALGALAAFGVFAASISGQLGGAVLCACTVGVCWMILRVDREIRQGKR